MNNPVGPIKIELSGELIRPVEIHLARRVLDKVWPIAILVNKPFPGLTYLLRIRAGIRDRREYVGRRAFRKPPRRYSGQADRTSDTT